MAELQPIFNDVERKAVAAVVTEHDGNSVLALELLAEDGSTTRLLTLNKFDAKQLSAACDRYVHQQQSIDYSNVNTLLTEIDRVELLGEDDDD